MEILWDARQVAIWLVAVEEQTGLSGVLITVSILETEGLRLRKGEFRAQYHRAGRTWGLGALNPAHLTVSFSWRYWNG